MGEIYIGSSNISRSALTSGIEWNHRFSSLEDQEDLRLFCENFEDLFAHHSIVIDDQELRVIFSVDMFNEGVDIAPLDMVMFLRPTESPVVFLQQLGRGLRTSKGKTYLNVLDFIGNYEKAGRAPLLLSGEKSAGERALLDYAGIEYPDDCIVDFDLRLIDLFREMEKRSLSVKGRIRQEFYRVKDLLDGKVPTRMELSAHMEEEVYQYCIKHPKENPFRGYMDLLKELEELSVEEERIYGGIGRGFLSLIETTDMQKVYKMPIRFLKASGKGFFVDKDGYALALREEPYIRGYTAKSRAENEHSIAWCEKMLERTKRGDMEGFFRLHWLLIDSLEIYFDLKGQYYFGPKNVLRQMREKGVISARLYDKALRTPTYENIRGWVDRLKGSF